MNSHLTNENNQEDNPKYKSDLVKKKVISRRLEGFYLDREDMPEVKLYNKWREVRVWCNTREKDKWLDDHKMVVQIKEEDVDWFKNEYINFHTSGRNEAHLLHHQDGSTIKLRAPSFYGWASKECIYEWIEVYCSIPKDKIRLAAIYCESRDTMHFYHDEGLILYGDGAIKS